MNDRYRSVGRSAVAWMVLVSLPVVMASCSTQDSNPEPGDGVLTTGTSRVVASSLGGGYRPQIPAGAACHGEYSFDLALPGGELTWSICRVQGDDADPASYTVDSGTRTLTATERGQVLALIQAIRVSHRTGCGADLDVRKLDVTSGGATTTYGDDFYECYKMYDRYVTSDSLASLLAKYGELTTQPTPAH